MKDQRLLQLRSELFETAASFHRAAAEYYDALRTPSTPEIFDEIRGKYLSTAKLYESAQQTLLEYLDGMERDAHVEIETERIKLLQESIHTLLRFTD